MRDVDHPRKCHRGKREPDEAEGDSQLSPNCPESRGDGGVREGEGMGSRRKRPRADLFSTPAMRRKPGGAPEARKPAGMSESPAALEVARAEVKVLMEAVRKVSGRHVPVSDPWSLGDTDPGSRPVSAAVAPRSAPRAI